MTPITERLKHAWNAFMNKDPTEKAVSDEVMSERGISYYYKPDTVRFSIGNDRNIITSIINRIAVDCASIDIRHVRLAEFERFDSFIVDELDLCLTTEANMDQTGRNLIEDIVLTLLDEGTTAVVPIDTDEDPMDGSFTIYTLRVGKIVEWRPSFVKVRCYNERNGKKEEIWVAKANAAILENPFYAVMNDITSTAFGSFEGRIPIA